MRTLRPPVADTVAPERADDFENFVAPHWTSMSLLAQRLAGPADWEDVLQDAVTAAWRKRDRFDPARGSARSFLLAIVADAARKSRRRRRPLDVVAPDVSDPSARVTDAVDVERVLHRLSPRQRLAVETHYFLDLSVADVAAVMGCSVGTVKSTLSDARARLRDLLEGTT